MHAQYGVVGSGCVLYEICNMSTVSTRKAPHMMAHDGPIRPSARTSTETFDSRTRTGRRTCQMGFGQASRPAPVTRAG